MLLNLKNIGKIYNSNDILTIGIRGVNLDFDYNEFVTIEGESGSGKSTLLNVIGANDSYEEGELYFNGFETSHYSESEWEKYREQNIATVFQDFNIIENLTVIENVELALFRIDNKKERRRIACELIEKVGLTKQAKQRGSKLSGGEKQRTVIARALAKDSPIILADEPTGNLDVKASREVAKLLKEVSKDKLVIVVTHNPEFFNEYATRKVIVSDGHIQEDKVLEKPSPVTNDIKEEIQPSRKRNFINTLHLGWLNYKSRPKFTGMMSFALLVCAISLFVVLSVFGKSLIQPVTVTLDNTAIEGKVILSASGNVITYDELDEIAGRTGAGFILADKDFSEFTVTVPKRSGMYQKYEVTCVYAPYRYNPKAGSAVLVMPKSLSSDSGAIINTFVSANVGIKNIDVETTLTSNGIYLYLSNYDLTENGTKIIGINSVMKLGETEWVVYSFESGADVEDGTVRLINSNTYEAEKYSAVFSVKSNKAYSIASADEKREEVNGLIVQMSENDYATVFEEDRSAATQSVLYYENDKTAKAALNKIPDGFMGLLSTSKIYAVAAGDVFTMNVVYYIALIAVCLLFSALIGVIFSRSVKVFQADFAVYRTLGISSKISSHSLYIQMALIFLPTMILLPIVSLIAAIIPTLNLTFMSVGNYFFIEVMLLLIVEFVAFGFNRAIKGQSIRKSLKRGSK